MSTPIRQQGTRFAFIKPSTRFTAISTDFENYFTLADLTNCKLMSTRYICDGTNPVQHVNDKAECEVQLLTNPQFDNLELCDIRLKTLSQTYWIKIQNTNAWLYAAPTSENLYIHCDNDKSDIKMIIDSGTLEIEPSCQAKTQTTKLVPSTEISIVHHVNFSRKLALNITEMIKNSVDTMETLNITEILVKTEIPSDLSNLDNVRNDLTRNEVALKSVIAKAQEITRTQRIHGRLSTIESILKFGGISLGSILVLATIGWRFSMFGGISSLLQKEQKRNTKRGHRVATDAILSFPSTNNKPTTRNSAVNRKSHRARTKYT